MPRLERYLLREFAEAVLATLVVLILVSLGGLVVDVLRKIAEGRLPAALMLSQLGLRTVQWLPLVLPLALFLGLLLAVSRLYRDSEMAVLAAIGVGPQRLWRPLAWVAGPVLIAVAVCALWAAPAAERASRRMIESANRSLLVAGLEAGRFVELPGGGVIYVDTMDDDGSRFQRVFIQNEDAEAGRLDVTTAERGELFFDGTAERYLLLEDGFRVEGPLQGKDFRLMRYARNELQLPDREGTVAEDAPVLLGTMVLAGRSDPSARAELHWRIGLPILTALLALMAIPLARAEPRQPRYGRLLLAFLAYLVYMNLLSLGRIGLDAGTLPASLGLWWLHLPALAIAAWLFRTDGRLPRRKVAA